MESQKITSQLDDFLGAKYLFSKRKKIFGFPENRIVRDSEAVWETYNIFLDKQISPISKNSNDIYNGFNSSLGNWKNYFFNSQKEITLQFMLLLLLNY